MKPRAKKLAVKVTREGVLTIEIGVDALKFATEHGQYRADVGQEPLDDRPHILDAAGFAKSVAAELMDEVGEDGSTPITLALDRAIESALESDTEHVRMGSDA